jgi:ATP-binding cassette, subfamily D (ALD), peroxisomal long-chain fatty acid import protein
MYAYKDVLELAGLTGRLYTLLSGLHALQGVSHNSLNVEGEKTKDGELVIRFNNVDVGVPPSTLSSDHTAKEDENSSNDENSEKVPSPTEQTLLVRNLTFTLLEGRTHLMITGSNGVGKTAVARVLAGLWEGLNEREDGENGIVERPPGGANLHGTTQTASEKTKREGGTLPRPSLLIVPQRSYMVAGTLLDQVIYPHTYADFLRSGRTLAEVRKVLEGVSLGYLEEREGGLVGGKGVWVDDERGDEVNEEGKRGSYEGGGGQRKEWRDVLSGGEKQRMGLARVFWHRPRFAVLDGGSYSSRSLILFGIFEREGGPLFQKSWKSIFVTACFSLLCLSNQLTDF